MSSVGRLDLPDPPKCKYVGEVFVHSYNLLCSSVKAKRTLAVVLCVCVWGGGGGVPRQLPVWRCEQTCDLPATEAPRTMDREGV
jgi:hypothetical protein